MVEALSSAPSTLSRVVLCVLCGLPGAGKSSLVRHVMSSMPPSIHAVHIDFDRFLDEVFMYLHPPFSLSPSLFLSLSFFLCFSLSIHIHPSSFSFPSSFPFPSSALHRSILFVCFSLARTRL